MNTSKKSVKSLRDSTCYRIKGAINICTSLIHVYPPSLRKDAEIARAALEECFRLVWKIYA